MNNIWDKTIKNDRFDALKTEKTMKAIVTSGNGGYEKLECREVKIPTLKENEVLIQVLAAGVNNTEINTRVGWYSKTITSSTEALVATNKTLANGGWNRETPFPFIQGSDCCGKIVAVFNAEDNNLIGSRVLVRSCMRKTDFTNQETYWLGSDFDGAFAQYVKVLKTEAFVVESNWSDAELGSIPCAYGTAENMVSRGKIKKGENVLVTGASGGVGSALIQLLKRRGAIVTAVTSPLKVAQVFAIGADQVCSRDLNLVTEFNEEYFDAIIDNVAGENFQDLLKLLKRGGRYISSGAIGGPLVSFDMRTFYLKDLTLIGCTAWDESVFPNLITYIENEEIKPLVAKVFPLVEIVTVQKEFLKKKHLGNFVLIPPKL